MSLKEKKKTNITRQHTYSPRAQENSRRALPNDSSLVDGNLSAVQGPSHVEQKDHVADEVRQRIDQEEYVRVQVKAVVEILRDT
jgi:hypothetical protein